MSEEPPVSGPLNYAPPQVRPYSAMAFISMILGILATPLDLAWEAGLLVGLTACILGAISLERIKRRQQRGKAFALAGIILGCLSLLVGISCGIYLGNNL